MTDERYKQLMEQIGMPNSRSLLQALQQVANEVEQEIYARLAQTVEHATDNRAVGGSIPPSSTRTRGP